MYQNRRPPPPLWPLRNFLMAPSVLKVREKSSLNVESKLHKRELVPHGSNDSFRTGPRFIG